MRRCGPLTVCALLALVAAVVAAAPAVGARGSAANSCAITQSHSLAGSVATSIQFVNKTAGTVKVYWLSYAGKRVYYWTLAPGASYVQRTFDTNPWVILTSSAACIGYVIAPRAQYVISGTASGASTAAPAPTPAKPATPAEPHWVYEMINDFNLGISQPSGTLAGSYNIYRECVAVPPDFAFVDGNSRGIVTAVGSFASYSKLIPGWIAQIRALKPSAASKTAAAKLTAAIALHDREVKAWEGAVSAVGRHDCTNFLAYLKQAQQEGAPDWADQYVAVNAIARLFGSNAASDQTPYAQKLG